MNFLNIHYLKEGNPKQVKAFEVLTNNNIFITLTDFNPILVGTIPINIDIETSDLDIICCWKKKQEFIDKLESNFKQEKHFTLRETEIDSIETVIANFTIEDFEIEIFGQNVPSENQNGYRHMLIEYEILKEKGEAFRLEIIRLKEQGYKTEPAFGLFLGLDKNPYAELLDYKL